MEIFWAIFGTVISGVIVFIISQCVLEFVIKPKIKYNELKKRILYLLTLYENLYSNPIIIDIENSKDAFEYYAKSPWEEASEAFRKVGAELSAYNIKKNEKIVACLIGLSNSMWCYKESFNVLMKANCENSKYIRKKLQKRRKIEK